MLECVKEAFDVVFDMIEPDIEIIRQDRLALLETIKQQEKMLSTVVAMESLASPYFVDRFSLSQSPDGIWDWRRDNEHGLTDSLEEAWQNATAGKEKHDS